MKSRGLFIGTGASLGVPVIGCTCPVCQSTDPKNKRSRSSLLITSRGKKLLIDAGPDLRCQALAFSIDHIDGVLLTHAHHDHTAGLDDLRIYHFRNQAPVPCLVNAETAEDLKKRFYYMFGDLPHTKDRVELQILPEESGEIEFQGVPLRYFTYDQVGMTVLGFRFGKMAYVTDIKAYSEEIFDELKNLDILILSALRFGTSHMHLTVDEAVEFVRKVKPKKTYLTHTAHELDYEKTNHYLKGDGIELAFDGLEFTYDG